MEGRIELREQSADTLADESTFDLAWIPAVFIPERALPKIAERTLHALRPDGWMVFVFLNTTALDPTNAAFWRLRGTMWGGPLLSPPTAETLAKNAGFVDVRTLPTPPNVPVGLVVGRRPRT
jgi:hypothetical protein